MRKWERRTGREGKARQQLLTARCRARAPQAGKQRPLRDKSEASGDSKRRRQGLNQSNSERKKGPREIRGSARAQNSAQLGTGTVLFRQLRH